MFVGGFGYTLYSAQMLYLSNGYGSHSICKLTKK